MKEVRSFYTPLSKDQVLNTLKVNTLPSEDLQAVIFDGHYFAGVVDQDQIRLRNSARGPNNPSPILNVVLQPESNRTKVLVYDDSARDIRKNQRVTSLIVIPIALLFLSFGLSVLFVAGAADFAFYFLVVLAIGTGAVGWLNSAQYADTIALNQKADVDFLITLLK